MLRVHWLAVLVHTEEADIQVVSRILEVIRIAAEERDTLLRREHQPHIGVTLVTVEMVLAAIVKSNHIAAQARLVAGFTLDIVDGCPAGPLRRSGIDARI